MGRDAYVRIYGVMIGCV